MQQYEPNSDFPVAGMGTRDVATQDSGTHAGNGDVAPEHVGAQKIPLIRRSRAREELEYDLLLVLLWVSKNVPSSLFEQIYSLIWMFTRLDEGERDTMMREMRALGDARFGPNRDATSEPTRPAFQAE